MQICISCKKEATNDKSKVRFPCPQCNAEIIRCGECKKKVVKYKCACGFEGP
ncbi:MAG: zinc finger domain-containing protein [Candidatus Nanoarchaeia archaeon]